MTQPIVITVQPAEALTPEIVDEIRAAWLKAVKEAPSPIESTFNVTISSDAERRRPWWRRFLRD